MVEASTLEDATTKLVVLGADEEGQTILITFNANAGDVYAMLSATYAEVLKIISKDAPPRKEFN
jgi:hypothetical protein